MRSNRIQALRTRLPGQSQSACMFASFSFPMPHVLFMSTGASARHLLCVQATNSVVQSLRGLLLAIACTHGRAASYSWYVYMFAFVVWLVRSHCLHCPAVMQLQTDVSQCNHWPTYGAYELESICIISRLQFAIRDKAVRLADECPRSIQNAARRPGLPTYIYTGHMRACVYIGPRICVHRCMLCNATRS